MRIDRDSGIFIPMMILCVIASCSDSFGGADHGVPPDLGQQQDRGLVDAHPVDLADLLANDRGAAPWKKCIKRWVPIDNCVPTNNGVEVCDNKDNDCNKYIDDVDEGNDGIYDCDKIALIGDPGPRASSDFLAWLKKSTKPQNVVRIQTTSSAPPLTKAVLEQYDVIILDKLVRSYTQQEADLLRTWIEAGCGVAAMTGHTAAATAKSYPNSLLMQLGLKYAGELKSGPVSQFHPHPVTQGITKPVRFIGGYRVEQIAGTVGGTTTKIADLPDGSAAGMVQARGASDGRVVVWGDEWIEYDSEWTNASYDVPKLWSNILRWLGHYQ